MSKYTPKPTQPELPLSDIPYGYCHCGCGQKTAIAKVNERRRGHVKGQPLPYIQGHNMRRLPTLAKAFWASCSPGKPDECWEWAGYRRADGYGQITRKGRARLAHRASYELHFGPIPKGMHVCHRCDNPICVNPHHLFLGTDADNVADMIRKNRQPLGQQRPNAKLCIDDVLEIRRQAVQGTRQEVIAKQFGITQSIVSGIVNRKRWRHVE